MSDILISRIRDYIALSEQEVRTVNPLFRKEFHRKNDLIVKQGDICEKLYFIEKGIISLTLNIEGKEKCMAFRLEGCFGSILESFCIQSPSPVSIYAIEPCTLYTIYYNDIQTFFNLVKEGDRFGRLIIEEVIMEASNHLFEMHTLSPEQRFVGFMEKFPTLANRIPQHMIASFLGIAPQTLCRIKKRYLKPAL